MSTNKSVLVVNTDVEALSKLKQRLPDFGFDVEVANTFESGQLQARQGSFDLLLICFDAKTEGITGYVRELRDSGVKTPMLIMGDVLHQEMLSRYELSFTEPNDFNYVYSDLATQIENKIWRHESECEGRSSTWRLGINNQINDRLNDHFVPADKTPRITESDARVLQALFAGGPPRSAPTLDCTSDGWKDDLRMVKTGVSNLLKRVGRLGDS